MFIYEILNKSNNKRYIGQTVKSNLTERWKEHVYMLTNQKHHNQHLQSAWNKYGPLQFKFKILELCDSEDALNKAESKWIIEYKTLNRNYGYNLQVGGSKHSAYQVRINRSKKQRPSGYPNVVDEMGIVYTITNLREFARRHNLTQFGLRQVVVTKKYFHYKGWRLATDDTINIPFDDTSYIERGARISQAKLTTEYPNVFSPNGTIYTVTHLSQFCRQHKLSKSNLSMLLRGKKSNYKGWTVV